jgi:hypothetical protein
MNGLAWWFLGLCCSSLCWIALGPNEADKGGFRLSHPYFAFSLDSQTAHIPHGARLHLLEAVIPLN